MSHQDTQFHKTHERSNAVNQVNDSNGAIYDERKRVANEAYDRARTQGKPVTWVDPETKETHTANPPRVVRMQPGFRPVYDRVDDDYAQATFEPIDVCRGQPVETRVEKLVLLNPYELTREPNKQAILAALKARGLRPATHEELEQYQGPRGDFDQIVALGSVASQRAGFIKEYVPMLKFEHPEKILGVALFFSDPVATLAGSCGVLAVRA